EPGRDVATARLLCSPSVVPAQVDYAASSKNGRWQSRNPSRCAVEIADCGMRRRRSLGEAPRSHFSIAFVVSGDFLSGAASRNRVNAYAASLRFDTLLAFSPVPFVRPFSKIFDTG